MENGSVVSFTHGGHLDASRMIGLRTYRQLSAAPGGQEELVLGWPRYVGSAAVLGFDDTPEMIGDLMQTGRFEVRWSGSIVKWVALQDQLTGLRALGRSYDSWNTALGLAVQEMRRLLAEAADH